MMYQQKEKKEADTQNKAMSKKKDGSFDRAK